MLLPRPPPLPPPHPLQTGPPTCPWGFAPDPVSLTSVGRIRKTTPLRIEIRSFAEAAGFGVSSAERFQPAEVNLLSHYGTARTYFRLRSSPKVSPTMRQTSSGRAHRMSMLAVAS